MKKIISLTAAALLLATFAFAQDEKPTATNGEKTANGEANQAGGNNQPTPGGMEYNVVKPVSNIGQASRAYSSYNRGYDLYLAKDYPDAINELLKTIKSKPEFAKSYNLAGLCYMAMDKTDKGLTMFKEAFFADNKFAEAAFNIANAYEIKKKYDLAEKFYLKAMDLNDDNFIYVRSALNLSGIYRQQRKFDDAIVLVRKAIIYEPGFAKLYNSAGLTYLAAGDKSKDPDTKLYNLAIDNFKTAIQVDQKYVEAANNLAITYERKGQLDTALGVYEQALKMNYEFPGANYNYGRALLEKGQTDRGIAFLQKAIQLDPKFAEAHYVLGKGYFSKNMFKEAGTEYKAAIKIKKADKSDYPEAKQALSDLTKQMKEFTSHIIRPTPTPEDGGDNPAPTAEENPAPAAEGSTAPAVEGSTTPAVEESAPAATPEMQQNNDNSGTGNSGTEVQPKKKGEITF